MQIARDIASLRAAPAPQRRARWPSCRPWATCTPATFRWCGCARRHGGSASSSASSSTGCSSSRSEDFDALPAHLRARLRACSRPRACDLVFAPDETSLYPRAADLPRLAAGRSATSWRAASGPASSHGVVHGRAQAPELRAAARRRCSARRTTSSSMLMRGMVRQLDLPVADRRRRDGARSRRPGDELAQRLSLARRSAPRRPACTGPCARWHGGKLHRRRRSPSWRGTGWKPDYVESPAPGRPWRRGDERSGAGRAGGGAPGRRRG